MLTAKEVIDFADGLQVGNHKTIDLYLFNRLGFDYDQAPFYGELKQSLDQFMIRNEIQYNGYTQHEWEWR